jgi:hypothetical protein
MNARPPAAAVRNPDFQTSGSGLSALGKRIFPPGVFRASSRSDRWKLHERGNAVQQISRTVIGTVAAWTWVSASSCNDVAMSNEYPAHTPGTDISSSVATRHVPTNVAQVIAVIMVVLALAGVGITLTNAAWAEKYWLILVPTYGLLCTFAAWYHARALDRMVARQICTGPVSALRWRWTLPYCEAVVSRPQRQRD